MRILIIEDDENNARFMEKGLKEAGHAVEWCASGADGLAMALSEDFDAVVLDRMLPHMDGVSILKTLRSEGRQTPVLLLSALGQLDHRVEGLKAGADDYLAKPFAFSELLVRLETIARRARGSAGETTKLQVGDLELDLVAHAAKRGGRAIELLPREYRILEYLMRNAGRTVTRTMLLENVWDYQFDPQTNVIDVHISRLRRKIDKDEPPLIHTIRGAGYRLSS
ncbi:MAG TPA: response regulator transcription factor [Parvularculaceae bacterium]|nr:response regulator transcription factor [Parvularculaceae bacterium]